MLKTNKVDSFRNISKKHEHGHDDDDHDHVSYELKELYKISPKVYKDYNEVNKILSDIPQTEHFGFDPLRIVKEKLNEGVRHITNELKNAFPKPDQIFKIMKLDQLEKIIEAPVKIILKLVDNIVGAIKDIIIKITSFNPVKELGLDKFNISKIFGEVVSFLITPVVKICIAFFKIAWKITYEIIEAMFGKEFTEWFFDRAYILGVSWGLILSLTSINTTLFIINKFKSGIMAVFSNF
mgnify:FL=1